MRRRLVVILFFAAAVGLVASLLVYQVVRSIQQQALQYQKETEEVVVAAVNIGVAETITRQHVKIARWPASAIPAGAVRRIEDADGRFVRTSIVAGEPLLDAKLAPTLAGPGGIMPVLVPEGQRGVTIKIDEATRESGFIVPNSHVDVLVSMPKPGSTNERISKVILQDVVVLAAGQRVEIRDNKPVSVTNVTLALTPEQTEKLAVAQSEGKLLLATRNLRDNQIVRTPGATASTLLADRAVAAAPPAPAPRPVRVAAPARTETLLPPPRIDSHNVAVIRDGRVSEKVFVRDPQKGWVERGADQK
ncbi:MAG TPA: Flp pilus assembly protein CpaB [Candidatus Tectomicrobia bacterium]|nr:Flp pilus assembly protein CpaB [Candidatus Tectomicrobia bacterium]